MMIIVVLSELQLFAYVISMKQVLIDGSTAADGLTPHEAMDIDVANVTKLVSATFSPDDNRGRATKGYNDDIVYTHEARTHTDQPTISDAKFAPHL
jgi:hypothetical protein